MDFEKFKVYGFWSVVRLEIVILLVEWDCTLNSNGDVNAEHWIHCNDIVYLNVPGSAEVLQQRSFQPAVPDHSIQMMTMKVIVIDDAQDKGKRP